MLPARKFNGLSSLPDFFSDFFDGGVIDRVSAKAPAINVIEDDKQYKIEVAAPGLTKEDFKVHVNKEGNLVIEMEKKKESEEKDEKKKMQDRADELKKNVESIVSKYAADNKQVRQIIDLALLSNNMLKGEALSSFVKRSFELLKK